MDINCFCKCVGVIFVIYIGDKLEVILMVKFFIKWNILKKVKECIVFVLIVV